MAIGETILGAVLQVVFDRLASPQVLKFFKASKIDQSLVIKLKYRMQEAGKLLADAEQKQFTESAVKEWLTDLKHLFYQAEEIADAIATEALRSSSSLDEPESLTTKVRQLNPFSTSSFATSVNSKMREVVAQLDDMVSRSDALNLREASVNTASRNRESTSFIPLEDAQVFGRDQEKEELLKFLRSEEAERNRINVVAIVGMGGMGKTTLAKLVYNDKNLGSFEPKAWVYVSDQFDISRVIKSILQNITCESYSDSFDLEFLCRELRGKLNGKRFFLVLDDVWNEKYEDWKSLLDQLTVGAQGSKIIVTTRNDGVASIMCTVPAIRLKPLLDDDGWSLFSAHAFEVGNTNSDPRIESLGRKIVDKCGGLPLAIKTLGGLLRCKEGINEWEAILQSSLWDLPADKSNVAPALWLSYHHLPSRLKRCFSYCALFPKGYHFDSKKLVLLWMAENFVQPPDSNRRIEDVGEDYLGQLLSRSFFGKSGIFVVMHDFMHDLAQAVSANFFARLECGEIAAKIPEKTRYFFFSPERFDVFTKTEGLLKSEYLRTFISCQFEGEFAGSAYRLSSKISAIMSPQFSCLRVLSLSHYRHLELPESIENLKQLRYLDVSGSHIKELPESVSNLCNLQTLLLSDCSSLWRLPADMRRLVLLRHLDIRYTSLSQMPKHMRELKHLQTLSVFVVSKHCGQGIEELRELRYIRGKLALTSLQNVSSPADALEANMSCREYVTDLALEFDETDGDDSVKGREVVENLKPHGNLERLTIINYPGTQFPSWLDTQCSMYKRIVDIWLTGCKYCCRLPPFGQLPCLTSLEIVGMEYVVTIGSEFYGYDSADMNPFPVLRRLRLEDMKMWKEWSGHEIEGRLPFPCLEVLTLRNCPELEGDLPANLASLKELRIDRCDSLTISPAKRTSTSIEWSWQPAWEHRALGRSFHLTRLELRNLKQLASLPPQVALLSCLKTLDLWGLEKLESLENVRLPTNLRCLRIGDCKILKRLPREMDLLNHLQSISTSKCPSLEWAPEDTVPTSLRSLGVDYCESWEFPIPEGMQRYSSLEELSISRIGGRWVSFPIGAIPNLRRLSLYGLRDLETVYIPRGTSTNLINLKSLCIGDCPKLKWIGKTEEDGVVDLPTPNLEELVIMRCESCDILKLSTGGGEGGLPSKLLTLRVDNFNAVRNPRSLLMFSCLRTLELQGHDGEYFPDNMLSLPTTISVLRLWGFPNLKKLNGEAIKTLTSLRRLTISNCPNLQCLPDEGLPSSLGYLYIVDCPLLKERCKRNKGPDWPKIEHIPDVQIYFLPILGASPLQVPNKTMQIVNE